MGFVIKIFFAGIAGIAGCAIGDIIGDEIKKEYKESSRKESEEREDQ